MQLRTFGNSIFTHGISLPLEPRTSYPYRKSYSGGLPCYGEAARLPTAGGGRRNRLLPAAHFPYGLHTASTKGGQHPRSPIACRDARFAALLLRRHEADGAHRAGRALKDVRGVLEFYMVFCSCHDRPIPLRSSDAGSSVGYLPCLIKALPITCPSSNDAFYRAAPRFAPRPHAPLFCHPTLRRAQPC